MCFSGIHPNVREHDLDEGQKNMKLLQYFNEMRLQERFVDVTIVAGGQRISAHKMVLAYFSDYFKAQFHFDESKKEISLEVDGKSATAIIEFMYNGCIDINTYNVCILIETANFLQVDEVKKSCFKFLEKILTIETWSKIMEISTFYNSNSTLRKTYQYISKNFEEISQGNNVKQMTKDRLETLIAKLDRNIVEETTLYKAILNWTQADNSRTPEFVSFFSNFNLYNFPYKFVENEIAKEPLVLSNRNCNSAVAVYLKTQATHHSKILLIGGSDSKSVKEVYTLSKSSVTTYPDLLCNLSRHCSLKVDNFVYCLGGSVDGPLNPTNKVYRMDLNEMNLQWIEITPMKVERCDFAATVFDRNIIVAGGWKNDSSLDSVELYDIQTKKWKKLPSMFNKGNVDALVIAERILFAIGGQSGYDSFVERFDEEDGIWECVPLNNNFRSVSSAVSYKNFVYTIGGYTESKQSGQYTESEEPEQCIESEESKQYTELEQTVGKYNPIKNQWDKVCNLSGPIRYRYAVCVLNGKIYVVGGRNNDGAIKTIDCYDPDFNQWSIAGKIEHGVEYHTLVAL